MYNEWKIRNEINSKNGKEQFQYEEGTEVKVKKQEIEERLQD